MVTRNELGRYLPHTLAWLVHLTDCVHVHDDYSEDGTYDYLSGLANVTVSQRQPYEASFLQNESIFREAAWHEMENATQPTDRDWILSIDADEFLLGMHEPCDTRAALHDQVGTADALGIDAIAFDVGEVFRLNGSEPMVRVDGFWDQIVACRLVRSRQGAAFRHRVEGGGSVPTTWNDTGYTSLTLQILHLGYARVEDRQARYKRYDTGRGHNPRHIQSILEPPLLTGWHGQRPPVNQ